MSQSNHPMPPIGIVVMAKEPIPGRVKTRLCPPCTPQQAADLAEACLADTLEAVAATPCAWRMLALDGVAGAWLCPGIDVVAQDGQGLAQRLAGAFAAAANRYGSDAGAIAIGTDTPQLTPRMLTDALSALNRPAIDAVVGPAHDGGYWTLGLRRIDPLVFLGVPMSDPFTLMRQRERLEALGLRVLDLETLTDVDTVAEARVVAASIPGTRFAQAVAATLSAHAGNSAAAS